MHTCEAGEHAMWERLSGFMNRTQVKGPKSEAGKTGTRLESLVNKE